jgi:hypothetical protein
VDLRRRRRSFQKQIGAALSDYYKAKSVVRQTLHSDKRHGIGGAYPRFLLGAPGRAVITVDPDESAPVVNGIMRAAILWSKVVRRRVSVVVPVHRGHTIAARLVHVPGLCSAFEWLQWDGERVGPLAFSDAGLETRVHEHYKPNVDAQVKRICSLAPDDLQPVPHIAGRAVSIRLRGIEVARVTEDRVTYPMGEPIEEGIDRISRERRHGSSHPLARAHEERWLESNLVGRIRDFLPVRPDAVYPQVPSFSGEDRNIIDLLAITDAGRLVVIEIKANSDPELPFQAFDYWLAVERHRKAGDFERNGYFPGLEIRDEAALLVVIAPLLGIHRTFDELCAVLPRGLPLVQIGINQGWKKEIKVLRRKGALG